MSTATTAERAATPAGRAAGRLQVHAAICTVVFTCYILGRLIEGPAAVPFAVIGASACGWAWLLARALFDPAPRDAWWPRVVALTVMATGALATLDLGDGMLARVAGNAYVLSGSAALLLTFVEPFSRYRRDLPRTEKRFRFAFVAVYAVLVGASILDFRIPGAGDIDRIKAACALIGLIAGLAAVGFRLRRPLPMDARPARRTATADDARLAERLLRLLRDEAVHLEPELRIGDVAARLGEPEHRISQCISTATGFRNFNRLVNHHRIERAKALLADPGDGRSILEIAFDCGFASVGPFNRAFKDEVGLTPRAFRAARLSI